MTIYTVSTTRSGEILYSKGKNAVMPASAIESETRTVWANQLRFLVSALNPVTGNVHLTIRLECIKNGYVIMSVLSESVFNGIRPHTSDTTLAALQASPVKRTRKPRTKTAKA